MGNEGILERRGTEDNTGAFRELDEFETGAEQELSPETERKIGEAATEADQIMSTIEAAERINEQARESGDVHDQAVEVAMLREKTLREEDNHIIGMEN